MKTLYFPPWDLHFINGTFLQRVVTSVNLLNFILLLFSKGSLQNKTSESSLSVPILLQLLPQQGMRLLLQVLRHAARRWPSRLCHQGLGSYWWRFFSKSTSGIQRLLWAVRSFRPGVLPSTGPSLWTRSLCTVGLTYTLLGLLQLISIVSSLVLHPFWCYSKQ